MVTEGRESVILNLKKIKEGLELEKIEYETKTLKSFLMKKPAQLAFFSSLITTVVAIIILLRNGLLDEQFQQFKSSKADFDLQMYRYNAKKDDYHKKTEQLSILQDSIAQMEKDNHDLSGQIVYFKNLNRALSNGRSDKKMYFQYYTDSLNVVEVERRVAEQNVLQVKTDLIDVEKLWIKEKREAEKLDRIAKQNKIVF